MKKIALIPILLAIATGPWLLEAQSPPSSTPPPTAKHATVKHKKHPRPHKPHKPHQPAKPGKPAP